MIDIIMFSCHFWQPRCQKYVATFADSVGTFSIQNFAVTFRYGNSFEKEKFAEHKSLSPNSPKSATSVRFATIGNLDSVQSQQ